MAESDEHVGDEQAPPVHHPRGVGRWAAGLVSGSAGAAIVAAVVITSSPTDPQAVDPCIGADDVIRQIWDPEARAVARRGLGDRPDASTLVATIDEYATQWSWYRTDACRAAHARATSFDARAAFGLCLQRRAELLQAVVEVLGEGEALDAPGMLAALIPIEQCRDPLHLRTEQPLPNYPQRAGTVLLVRQRLARVAVLWAAGRDAAARASVQTLEDDVRTADHPPLTVRWQAWQLTLMTPGERAEPENMARLVDVIAAAERIGADTVAARLLVLRLDTPGQGGGTDELTAGLTEAKVARSGDPVAKAELACWRARHGADPQACRIAIAAAWRPGHARRVALSREP